MNEILAPARELQFSAGLKFVWAVNLCKNLFAAKISFPYHLRLQVFISFQAIKNFFRAWGLLR